MNLFRRNKQYLDRFVGVADKIWVDVDRYALVFVQGRGYTSTGIRIDSTREVIIGSIGLHLRIRTSHPWRDDV